MTVSTRVSRFSVQPVRDVILNDGRTLAGFARSLKCETSHALLAFAGRVPPSPELRAEVAARLNLPVEALFTANALAATYQAKFRPKAARA